MHWGSSAPSQTQRGKAFLKFLTAEYDLASLFPLRPYRSARHIVSDQETLAKRWLDDLGVWLRYHEYLVAIEPSRWASWPQSRCVELEFPSPNL